MNPTGGPPNRRFPWVWMGHREYDPLACRFLTRDPIGYDGGINLYAYCENNPINFADPIGFQVVETHEAAVATATAALNAARARFAAEVTIEAEMAVLKAEVALETVTVGATGGVVVGATGASVVAPVTIFVAGTATASFFAYQASDQWLAPKIAYALFDHGKSAAAAKPSSGFGARYQAAIAHSRRQNIMLGRFGNMTDFQKQIGVPSSDFRTWQWGDYGVRKGDQRNLILAAMKEARTIHVNLNGINWSDAISGKGRPLSTEWEIYQIIQLGYEYKTKFYNR